MSREDKGRWIGWAFVTGAVVAVLLLGAVRYARLPAQHSVHYHANWAVYIDGQRLDLSANEYMESVFQCSVDPSHQSAEDRVHMHENNQDVVHVHDSGVTWGHFLANVGMGLGDDYLEVSRGRMLRGGDGRQLKFILNGTNVFSIRNLPIEDQDRLLISYGDETLEQVVSSQYPTVASSAGEYNTRPDPASCAGAPEETAATRLRRAFWY